MKPNGRMLIGLATIHKERAPHDIAFFDEGNT
jgi:hypothetical protein